MPNFRQPDQFPKRRRSDSLGIRAARLGASSSEEDELRASEDRRLPRATNFVGFGIQTEVGNMQNTALWAS
jgi:hypothetical protein